ncbi:MAG: hypothetical protein ACMXYB_01210 [Candidatus Woesearchaeota archaeon]
MGVLADTLEDKMSKALYEVTHDEVDTSKSNSFSKILLTYGKYAAVPLALYGMYKKYSAVSSFLEPDNTNSTLSPVQGGLESRITSGQTQQQEESFMKSPTAQTALYGLKIMVGAYLALGGYQRLKAAREYYLNEVDNFDMGEEHLCGLAYALTYGEAPPSNVKILKKTGAFNAVYKTLKTLKIDRLDNTQLGSWAIVSLLSMGEQVGDRMGEEVGGGLFKKAKSSMGKSK